MTAAVFRMTVETALRMLRLLPHGLDFVLEAPCATWRRARTCALVLPLKTLLALQSNSAVSVKRSLDISLDLTSQDISRPWVQKIVGMS